MNIAETIYQKLADHLDQLPGGFISSDAKVDLRLLQRLFTKEEAKLAIHLTLDRENVEVISSRAKLPIKETEQRLNEMSSKGLIFSIQYEDSPALYQAVPFVI